MYHSLTGRLIEKSATGVVLDVSGVGYQVQIPVSTFSGLPELGQTVRLLTHFVVREDAHVLYGFLSEEERLLFRLLISVSGIGPKSAATVLSGVAIPDLKRAIAEGNVPVLTEIPGIGRKTAERIIVELREKLILEDKKPAPTLARMRESEDTVEDSLRALVELGYRKQNAQEAIQKALKGLSGNKVSVQDLIRASLKHV